MDASDPVFKQNYQNAYNIKNINCNEKHFEVKINENIKYPHYEDSDSEPEDYYYEDGLEDNYQIDDKKQYKLQKQKISKSKYQDFRMKYNENIIKDKPQIATNNNNNNEEEENEDEEVIINKVET